MPLRREVAHQLLPAPAAWVPCALDRRLASASVSSKAIIAILSKTRLIARMVLLPVRLFGAAIAKGEAASPPRMNSRRLMSDMGIPPPPGSDTRRTGTVGLPHAQRAAECSANPWGRPE